MNTGAQGEFSLGLFLAVLSIGTILATSIWLAYDAKVNRIPTTDNPYSIHNGALAWFISSVAIWIATFPYYLVRRRRVLQERRDAAVAAAAAESDPWTISFSVSRTGRTEARDRKSDLAGYYDTAQVCRNGHVITSHYNNCPSHRQEFCDQCGESTLTKCENCGTGIRGNYDVHGVATASPYVTPSFCHACGRAYPWTTQKLQVAKELVDELESLDQAEKQALKQSLDDLVRDTPKTEPAFYRFKKLMRKVDRESFEAVKAVVIDLASESVKQSIEAIDYTIPPSGLTEFYTRPGAPLEAVKPSPERANGHGAEIPSLRLVSSEPSPGESGSTAKDTTSFRKREGKGTGKARKAS